jgi:hypothetical protein
MYNTVTVLSNFDINLCIARRWSTWTETCCKIIPLIKKKHRNFSRRCFHFYFYYLHSGMDQIKLLYLVLKSLENY